MPGTVRKLVLFAAEDGLVLQPIAQRSQHRSPAPLIIQYSTHDVKPLLRDVSQELEDAPDYYTEVHGVIGVLKVESAAYVVAISRRKKVAQVWGRPVYCITGVAVIPLASREEAAKAITRVNEKAHAADGELDDSDDSDADGVTLTSDAESRGEPASEEAQSRSTDTNRRYSVGRRKSPGIAEEVINKKGLHGRFTERWLSKRGLAPDLNRPDQCFWSSSQDTANGVRRARAATDESSASGDGPGYQPWPQTPDIQKTHEGANPGRSGSRESVAISLLPKLLQTMQLILTSGTFFFSYDYDLTRNLAAQQQTILEAPIASQVDSQYFWNERLVRPLLDEGYLELVLPIMQGFVGQRNFSLRPGEGTTNLPQMPEGLSAPNDAVEASVLGSDTDKPATPDSNISGFLITIISRRSTKRAGLRYLRRGIDEDGNVANAVETEQMLSRPSWDSQSNVCSFLQTRGSIPVFFSQMPYTFKPLPTLHGSEDANQAAMRTHFSRLSTRYGEVQAVSLIDKHGPEVGNGEAYENHVKKLNDTGGINGRWVKFEWFEFHAACRGMKFENVSFLTETLTPLLLSSGFSTLQSSKLISTQSGVVRTNCMDCLDRTNVVQSALGQLVLSQQLATLGFSINLATDPSTTWFNTLRADNGDAVSKAYTGTSAPKGDYTRTRKRNALGALTDLSLTLTRYYRNLFDDFFDQACIDYLLGTVDESIFSEFGEHMTTADPAIDLQKARQEAIISAARIVVEGNEDLLHGWAMLMPKIPGTLRTFPFSEVLLLLTDFAIYIVSFDWVANKVHSFERVGLECITALQTGTYITETHTDSQKDPDRNVGLLIRHRPPEVEEGRRPCLIRVNTRNLDNVRDAWSVTGADRREEHAFDTQQGEEKRLAFKILSSRSATVKGAEGKKVISERDVATGVVEDLKETIEKCRANRDGSEKVPLRVEERGILTKDEARRSTGDVESLAWGLKRAIWG